MRAPHRATICPSHKPSALDLLTTTGRKILQLRLLKHPRRILVAKARARIERQIMGRRDPRAGVSAKRSPGYAPTSARNARSWIRPRVDTLQDRTLRSVRQMTPSVQIRRSARSHAAKASVQAFPRVASTRRAGGMLELTSPGGQSSIRSLGSLHPKPLGFKGTSLSMQPD